MLVSSKYEHIRETAWEERESRKREYIMKRVLLS